MPIMKAKLDLDSVGKMGWAFDGKKHKWFLATIIDVHLARIPFLSIGMSPSGYSEFNNFKVRTSIGEEFWTGLLGFCWYKPNFGEVVD